MNKFWTELPTRFNFLFISDAGYATAYTVRPKSVQIPYSDGSFVATWQFAGESRKIGLLQIASDHKAYVQVRPGYVEPVAKPAVEPSAAEPVKAVDFPIQPSKIVQTGVALEQVLTAAVAPVTEVQLPDISDLVKCSPEQTPEEQEAIVARWGVAARASEISGAADNVYAALAVLRELTGTFVTMPTLNAKRDVILQSMHVQGLLATLVEQV